MIICIFVFKILAIYKSIAIEIISTLFLKILAIYIYIYIYIYHLPIQKIIFLYRNILYVYFFSKKYIDIIMKY